jgi:DNA repair exonuclease SbcCD ATPase subunit
MNSLYRISKLTFNNFKLFGDEFTINFEGNELVVFDGPNGHGKTTVFDAIELALTGNIRRLNPTENQQTPSDVVVAHKNKKDCYIRIELINDGYFIAIERRLKDNISNSDKKIINFKNLWELVLINSDERQKISQYELDKLINSPNLVRDFTLFHYVEQEDTAHFLKQKNEKARADALSVLFGDTIKMQEKVFKVEQVKKSVAKKISDKTKEINILVQRGNLGTIKNSDIKSISFSQLLNFGTSIFEWDREGIEDLTPEKRDSFLSELHNIDVLVQHSIYFLNRRQYILATEQRDVLKSFIAYSKYIKQLDKIRERFRQVNLVTQISSWINVNNIETLLNSADLNDAFVLVGYESGELFINTLRQIVEGKRINKENSKFILELFNYRMQLKAHLHNQENEKECFLCGTFFDDHDKLIKSIENKESRLNSFLSNEDQRFEELQSNFFKEILPIFSDKLIKYLAITKSPTETHISELERIKKLTERFTNLALWLDSERIPYSDLLLTYTRNNNSDSDIDSNTSVLTQRILEKVQQSPEDFEELNESVNFEDTFKIYFEASSKNLTSITSKDIDSKRNYIQQKYLLSISNDIKLYQSLELEISKLAIKEVAVLNLLKNLKSAVSRYQKLLIKDIEIPFYIYSGKVLQAHQSGIGNGIFIKDKTGGDELKNIRFVSNWESDHDVINTMSSGQIAAVVITLYLALNKVYSKGFGTLLIDDPVQTMDEINMISLVELLRNEFSDRQIILSTHEDHVSRYFIYKFLKYRRNVKQVKLLERKEYQLSNQ